MKCVRWWPGQICYPEVIPLNIRDLPHDVGQFAVYFFGTKDYLWTHHGRYGAVTTCSVNHKVKEITYLIADVGVQS